MNFEIISLHAEPNDAFREYVQQRLHYGLLPFEHRISKATVVFSDLKGPRSGADQHCDITLSLTAGQKIRAEGRAVSERLALGRAAERASRQLRRLVEATENSRRSDVQNNRYLPAA
ncbi:MAG: HPF/RaiA family ribosome-associated protein [Phycisphaerae bacterium]|jgi:ribosomal subunit interface protein